MKQLSLLLIAALLATAAQARIWRVNNNPGVAADFTTVQTAHNGAAAGDTIHLEPSIYSYGSLNLNKKLFVVSTGQFVADNPGYQQDARMGYVDNVTIDNAGANGSVLSLRCSGRFYINGSVGNIALLNCANTYAASCDNSSYGVFIFNAYNITISGSWISNITVSGTSSNIIISNNIIGGNIGTGSATSGIVVRNNVINAVAANCNYNYMQNSQVINNIFNKGFAGGGAAGAVYQNNFSSDNSLPSGNGNVNNVTMSNVFVNAAGNFVDNQYQLKAGSPAIGAGLSGEDLGAFGGTSPFRLAVTPAIPSIYKLVVPTTPVSNTMNITFSTKSN